MCYVHSIRETVCNHCSWCFVGVGVCAAKPRGAEKHVTGTRGPRSRPGPRGLQVTGALSPPAVGGGARGEVWWLHLPKCSLSEGPKRMRSVQIGCGREGETPVLLPRSRPEKCPRRTSMARAGGGALDALPRLRVSGTPHVLPAGSGEIYFVHTHFHK